MAVGDSIISSNVTPFVFGPLTASASIKRKDFVIVLNPGTTGTYKEGANTASAVLVGVATDDADEAGGDTEVPVDDGGAIVERTYTGVAAEDEGRLVYVAGPDSVAATGNILAGRVAKFLGTNRCMVKCAPYSLAGAQGPTGPTGPTGGG